MYNPMVNQFERLIELGEDGKPTQMKFSISKVDMTQVIDNMEEVPLITEGERNSLPPFDALSSDVSINTWSRNQDADPKEKIREFFDRNIFWCDIFFPARLQTYSFNSSPEATSNDQSLEECNTVLETSDTDSETEPSLSQEVSSHQKGLAAESLWAGHAVQANRSLAAVLTVEQPIVVNVTDGLLSTLQDLVDGEELSAAGSELINNLGGEGSIVYTEIKVILHSPVHFTSKYIPRTGKSECCCKQKRRQTIPQSKFSRILQFSSE